MPTVSEKSGSGEQWWKAVEDGMVIRGRRTVDDFVAVTWTGRAPAPRLETFMLDEAVGPGPVRALAWTVDSLIETDPFSHVGGTREQLAAAKVSPEDVTFIKMQAAGTAGSIGGVVAWSKLDEDNNADTNEDVEPSSQWDYPDRYADVGVLLPCGDVDTLEPHIARFIGATYSNNDHAKPEIETVQRVLRSLVDAMTN